MRGYTWQTMMIVGAVGVTATLASGGAAGAAGRLRPQIVNGIVTSDLPSVGLLLDATDGLGVCTGTLIGCRTFVTAAHCVCPGDAAARMRPTRRGKPSMPCGCWRGSAPTG